MGKWDKWFVAAMVIGYVIYAAFLFALLLVAVHFIVKAW